MPSSWPHRLSALALCVLSPGLARPASGAVITTDSNSILVDGVPLFLKGVDYSPYLAGEDPGTGAIKVNYQNDLLDIKQRLHANAVRIYAPLPKAFYDAARAAGVWVIQGIYLDPNPDDFINAVGNYKVVVEAAVDLVYGAGGADTVLAWVIGSGFSVGAVSRTIQNHQDLPRFQGVHYRVPPANPANLPRPDHYVGCPEPTLERFPDPHPFQSFLAMLAETLALRELSHGGQRHLIGHASVPDFSPVLGTRDRTTPNPVDLSFLDVIFENAFTYANPYLAYLGFQSYLEHLKRFYAGKPVVLLETGYSTSPGGAILPPGPLCGFPNTTVLPHTLKFGGATEEEHALAIEARYVDVISSRAPLAGFFVFEYYDEWWLGGNSQQQDPNQPIEFFGLKSVGGTPNAPVITEKFAYKKLASLYGCGEPDASVAECGLVLRSPRVIQATFGKQFTHQWQVEGGTPPYRCTFSGDPPPPGLTLDPANCSISGRPERMGLFRIRVRVEDSKGLGRERLEALRVNPPLFETRERQILMNGEPFFLKGIDYSPFIAGDAPWTPVEVADPAKDLLDIKKNLHANSIRVYQASPKEVYDAARENGLFVIQGIHLQVDCTCYCKCNEECPNGSHPECAGAGCDLLDPCFLESQRQHVRAEVDEIHKAGAEDVVLCFVVGNEVNFCAQRRTIKNHQDQPRYQGRFYSAPSGPARLPPVDEPYPGCHSDLPAFLDPHPFQSFVAELTDLATVREVDRYGARHLMAHATEPNMAIVPGMKDRYEPACHFPSDMSFLDIVFQNTYSYFPPSIRFVSGYRGYLEEAAAAYPEVPYVILECGYSTSPHYDVNVGGCATEPVCGQPEQALPFSFCFGGNSEDEQALGIATQYLQATAPPSLVAGFYVFEYYDEWWKGADPSKGPFVQDDDKVEEWFGLLAVSGTRENLTIRKRKAYDKVAQMFSFAGGCPAEEQLEAEVGAGGVTVRVLGVEDHEGITFLRDGAPIGSVGPGISSYLDASPPGGEHRYGAVVKVIGAGCPAIEQPVSVPPSGEVFRRGDSDGNRAFDLTDPIMVLNALFLAGEIPHCQDAADSNDDGNLDLSDAVFSLNRLFLGGDPLPLPGPDACGVDPTTTDQLPPCRDSGCP